MIINILKSNCIFFLIGIFCCLSAYSLKAQSASRVKIIDSLAQLLQTDLTDTVRMDVLNSLGKKTAKQHYEKSKNYFVQYINLAEKNKDIARLADAKFTLSSFFAIYEEIDSVYEYSIQALELLQQNRDLNLTILEGKVLTNLAFATESRGEYQLALEYYTAAIDKAEDPYFRNTARYNRAILYDIIGDKGKALEIYTEIREFAKKEEIIPFEANVLSSIADTYNQLGQYQKAIEFHQERIKLINQYGNPPRKLGALLLLADVYTKIDISKAINQCKEVLDKAREMNIGAYVKRSLSQLVLNYKQIGDTQTALDYANQYYSIVKNNSVRDVDRIESLYLLASVYNEMKDYKKALFYANQSNAGFELLEDKRDDSYLNMLKERGKALQFTGNIKEAWKTIQIRDSLKAKKNTLNQKEALAGAEVKFQLREKELAFEEAAKAKELELTNAAHRQNLLIGLLGATGLILLGGFFAYSRLRKANKTIETQRKLVETTLLEKDEMKSRFFANISHELRTPLTLLLGPIQTVLESNKLEQQDYSLLSLAKQSGQQLHRLINSILDFSRLEIGQLELKEKPTLLYPLLNRIVAQFESNAQNKNINLDFNFLTAQTLKIQLDTEKFEIIVNNLLSNALKFTPKNGQIEVQLKAVNEQLELLVSDNGKGIHPEDLPHIFNRFYQTKVSKNKVEGGSGIGLALSQEYADLFKGTLRVESQLGVGSTFYFIFPKKEVEQVVNIAVAESLSIETAPIIEQPAISDVVPSKLPTSSISEGKRPSILVVEDNYDLQNYLQLILKDRYDLEIAENGQVALDMLETTSFDLIISDVMMPVMDGFQLLETLKKQEQFRSIPIIMLTALAGQKDRLKALRIGVDDYLTKPFDKEELVVRIDNLLTNYHQRQLAIATPTEEEASIEQTPVKSDWLQKLEQLASEQLSDVTFSIEALPAQLAMSRRSFFRNMKEQTGLTPNQYLREIRLQKAREIMETKEKLTVKEICYAVGFHKTSYFSQLFRNRFGKTPSDYMANYQSTT